MGIIFILDDEEDILLALEYWLSRVGYEVQVFTNSKDFCQALESCTPDLMLLDINLKGEDGRDICKKMREERHYHKSILYFSASVYVAENTKPCAHGFIAKPFDLNQLTKTINTFILI